MNENYDELVSLIVHGLDMEKKMASGNIRRLNAAMKSGCQDIKFLDSLADPLLDTMLGLSGRGERTYLRFLKYLETFSSKEAKQRREMYEDSMGYKIHTAYVAARLAKELHKGQVDKAGKDYFEEHLATVGGSGYDWKQKTVGFLHDVAEDTSYSVKDVIRFLQKELKARKARPEEQDWIDDFSEIIKQYPHEHLHMPSKDEWNEIEEALHLMNAKTAKTREEYINRFKDHFLAIKIKLNDLRHNMDISRLPNPTEKDYIRLERYQKEYEALMEMLREACKSSIQLLWRIQVDWANESAGAALNCYHYLWNFKTANN